MLRGFKCSFRSNYLRDFPELFFVKVDIPDSWTTARFIFTEFHNFFILKRNYNTLLHRCKAKLQGLASTIFFMVL